MKYFGSEGEMTPFDGSYGELPRGFFTFCNGRCGSAGWRVYNTSVESGFHSVQSEVDSELYLNTTFIQEGSISFNYLLNARKMAETSVDNGLPGFQFFIDGKPEDRTVYYHPEEDRIQSIKINDIAPGQHIFHWVFHQPLGSNRQKRIILSDIVVTGSVEGSAVEYVSCERGSYSPQGSATCQLCPPGTYSGEGKLACTVCEPSKYSDKFGSVQCESCGAGINATSDRMGCETKACVFTVDDVTYNLSSINSLVSFTPENSTVRYVLSLCSPLTMESECFDSKNVLINNTHTCAVDLTNGVGKDSGRLVNAYSDASGGLKLRYSKGDTCGTQMTAQMYTEIRFECDTNVTTLVDPVVTTSASCVIAMKWRHIAGCPICQPTDYIEQFSECIDHSHNALLVRNAECNGPQVINQGSLPCTPKFSISIPFAAFAVVAFLLLIAGLVVLGVRNKHMQDRYEMLVSNSNVERDFNKNTADDTQL
jgi:hypothetical protein